MDTQQTKEKLLNRIQEIEDSDLIQHLIHLIDAEIERKKGEPYQLTEMEREAIQVAEDDVQRNDLLSDQEANKKIKEWL